MPRVEHWFWGGDKGVADYAEVLLASLLINLFALVTPLYHERTTAWCRTTPPNAQALTGCRLSDV